MSHIYPIYLFWDKLVRSSFFASTSYDVHRQRSFREGKRIDSLEGSITALIIVPQDSRLTARLSVIRTYDASLGSAIQYHTNLAFPDARARRSR